MPLIVPGVARFAINQNLEGRNVVNVLDYRIDTTGSTMSRNDAVVAQAESIVTHWAGEILPALVDDLTFDSVSYVDLDAADGITGAVVSSDTETLPQAGGSSSDPLPANTAVLVTKQISGGRSTRNGRIYVGGYTEASTQPANGNRLSTDQQALRQTDFNDFLSNTNELDTLGTAFSSNMVVVHVTERDTGGAPVAGISTVVNSLVVDGLLATQRRRLRG